MSKKIYITLSALLFLSLPFLTRNLDWLTGYFMPVAVLAVAAILALAAVNFKNVFLFIILILPAAYHFNYLKINIASYLPFLNDYVFLLNPVSVIYLLIMLFGLATIINNWRELKSLPLKYIIAIASAYAAASIFWSAQPQTSLIELVYLIVPFFMYIIAYAHFTDYGSFLKLMLAAILSSIIPLAAAAGQFIAGSYFYEPDSALGRLMGTLDHPNTLGLYLFLIMGLLISWYLAKANSRLQNNKLIFFCLACVLFFFILTYSRTSWASLAVFLILLGWREKKIILYLLPALPAAAIILANFETARTRALEVFDTALFSSVTSRLNLWRVIFEQILKRPSFGHGVGAAESVIDSAKTWQGGISLPHNDYLLQTLELGLTGLAIFFAYTFGAIYYVFKTFKDLADKKTVINFNGHIFIMNFKTLVFGLFIVLISLLPATIFESLSQKIILQIIIWTLLGSLFSLKTSSLRA